MQSAVSARLNENNTTRICTTRKDGIAEGLAQGHAEGRAEGRAEAVRMMLAAGIPVETIAGALGISAEECEGYRNMPNE